MATFEAEPGAVVIATKDVLLSIKDCNIMQEVAFEQVEID